MVVVPGCLAMFDKPSCTLFEASFVVLCITLAVLFGQLYLKHGEFHRSCTDHRSYTDQLTSKCVYALVAPIIAIGSLKVINEFSDDQSRFTITVNSALSGKSFESKNKAIFDTGAARHIPNSSTHMMGLTADNSYSVVGVTGTGNKATCNSVIVVLCLSQN